MKPYLRIMTSVTLLGVTAIATPSYAAEVEFHGFVRTAYDVSNSTAKYAEVDDNRGDWGGTQAGLAFLTTLDDKWSIAGQYHASAASGSLVLDWALANFQFIETTKLVFGRQKYPLGLITENVDVGVTYPWARPPQELYHLEISADSPNIFFESFDGASVVYATGDDWEFTVQPFVGQLGYSAESTNYLRQMNGLKLSTESDILELQVGYVVSTITVENSVQEAAKSTVNFGVKLEIDDLLVMAEAADNKVRNNDHFNTKGAYLSVAYTFGMFQPYVYGAMAEGHKIGTNTEGNLDQTSVALGTAYHYSPSVVFKAQWLNIKPDDPSLNGLLGALPDGKTTVDLLTFSVDAVF